MTDTPTGLELIAAERQRQIEKEGWTPEHDDYHVRGDIARAAACYAMPPAGRLKRGKDSIPLDWPWDRGDWKPKPTDRIRELVKAGALIAAEIDRLQRAGS